MSLASYHPIAFEAVRLEGGFLGARQEVNRSATLPAIYRQLQRQGHLDAWKGTWKPGMPNPPHVFWDSDLAKWMEAAAYALALQRDPQLEAWVDEIVADMQRAQLADGYLNSHFIFVEPEKRWSNLRDCHELYCAGHLIEAAVAYARATGKTAFLDVMQRYADHIATVFGPLPGQKRGYPGHPEIELALLRLYQHTGEERYLRLSQFFIEERGRQPHYYDQEARARGEDPAAFWGKTYAYMQAHIPVRQQRKPVGHVVRGAYLYCGMADLARLTGDAELLDICRTLFAHINTRLTYVTGGVGSSAGNEGFTYDYDLPDETAYAETCSGIAVFFLAHRLLQFDGNSVYADAMERVLYNNILSAVSLDGKRFFYVNPVSVHRQEGHINSQPRSDVLTGHREEWFPCACCPPNIARLLAALGGYFYSLGDDRLLVHLYGASRVETIISGVKVALRQATDYPWEESVRFEVMPEKPVRFTLALRKPGWARQAHLSLNGQPVEAPIEKGYLLVERLWNPGDCLELRLPMPVERNYAHPWVRPAQQRAALSRGPLVYCLESVDNGEHLNSLRLPATAALHVAREDDLLGGVVTIAAQGLKAETFGWEDALYRAQPPVFGPAALKAIPYYAWDERQEGNMLIWINEV